MSDGGDGFGAVMGQSLSAKRSSCRTIDAAHRPCRAGFWWEKKTNTAIVDTAAIIGLAMLPPKRFHPYDLDTFGIGKVLRAAADRGAEQCLMGIGGSATNDGGFGLARAIGWQFLDAQGETIERWIDLVQLNTIVRPPSAAKIRRMKIRVAVDVQNPLLGPRGASRIYGPQKGLRPREFAPTEACLGQLASVTRRLLGRDYSRKSGSGAAGGLGFGLAAFLDAKLEPGFQVFASQTHLETQIKKADVIITGEGSIDDSSLMGKGVGEIGRECARLGKTCIALAGKIALRPAARHPFAQLRGITLLASSAQALADPSLWLSRLAEAAGRAWQEGQTAKA
jgi:glycerate kinase